MWHIHFQLPNDPPLWLCSGVHIHWTVTRDATRFSNVELGSRREGGIDVLMRKPCCFAFLFKQTNTSSRWGAVVTHAIFSFCWSLTALPTLPAPVFASPCLTEFGLTASGRNEHTCQFVMFIQGSWRLAQRSVSHTVVSVIDFCLQHHRYEMQCGFMKY